MGQKLVALGWKDATVEQALELLLGSEFFRQRVTSIMFFRDELPSGFLSDDPNVLVIYGIRAGMKLSTIPFFKYTGSPTVLAHAVSRRGVSYMQRFISDVRFGGSEFSLPLSNVGVATIMLASDPKLGLKIPCSQSYLHGWVAVSAKVFANLDMIENPSGLTLPTREQLIPRLHQHLAVALAEGIPLWGALGFLLIHLSRECLFDRAKLIGLFLSSIECAPRVSLRHRLVTVFTDNLMVTNAELFEHRHVLIPHLVAGELFFVKSFGGWLLPLLDGPELAAAATGALGVKNDGRKREILQILLDLKPPTEMTGELTACVRSLANSPNGDVAECAKELKYMWGIPDDPDCTQPPAR